MVFDLYIPDRDASFVVMVICYIGIVITLVFITRMEVGNGYYELGKGRTLAFL